MIRHPNKFKLNDVLYEVCALCDITPECAKKIVLNYIATHKPKKSDKGKTIQIITTIDTDSAQLF